MQLPAATGDVWYVYDGECPLCRTAARALRIREAVGRLHLINAREEPGHTIIQEINARGLSLDEGMVIKFGGELYHGADAIMMMALLGSPVGWFNRLNAVLFKSPAVARGFYPALRGGRNLLLWLKGVGQIRNLQVPAEEPFFKPIFGKGWSQLPPVMQKHYAVRTGSGDVVVTEGEMTIERSWLARLLAPLMRVCGALVPYCASRVPVTVRFVCPMGTKRFYFDRQFRFPGHVPYRFRSYMERTDGSEVTEFMRFGLGWRARYSWERSRVRLQHLGYVWRVFGLRIPVPLGLVLGSGDAWEEPIDDDSFRMWMDLVHPWFGVTYRYGGTFRITEVHVE